MLPVLHRGLSIEYDESTWRLQFINKFRFAIVHSYYQHAIITSTPFLKEKIITYFTSRHTVLLFNEQQTKFWKINLTFSLRFEVNLRKIFNFIIFFHQIYELNWTYEHIYIVCIQCPNADVQGTKNIQFNYPRLSIFHISIKVCLFHFMIRI